MQVPSMVEEAGVISDRKGLICARMVLRAKSMLIIIKL
jgi:hypothetical protein